MSSPCLLFLHYGATRRRPPTLVPRRPRLGPRTRLSSVSIEYLDLQWAPGRGTNYRQPAGDNDAWAPMTLCRRGRALVQLYRYSGPAGTSLSTAPSLLWARGLKPQHSPILHVGGEIQEAVWTLFDVTNSLAELG